MQNRRRWMAFLVLVAGCGGGSTAVPTPEEGTETKRTGLCTRVPALIAEQRACVAHDQCPCGTHCALGTCTATCLGDEDCEAGLACDDFGVCRTEAEITMFALPASEPGLGLSVTPAILTLEPQGGRPLVVRADRATTPIRVEARGPIRIAHCPGGPPGASCMLAPHRPGQITPVIIEAQASLAPDEPAFVVVYEGSTLQTVTVRAAPTPPGAPGERSGVYSGTLRLVRAGLGEELADVGAVEIPIGARYFESDGVVVLDDTLGALHPDRTWVGTIDANGIDLPAFELPNGGAVAGGVPRLVVSARTASVAFGGASAPVLGFDLVTTLNGALDAESVPRLHWIVNLERVADHDEDAVAPVVPTSAAPPSAGLAAVATPWEVALAAALGPEDVGIIRALRGLEPRLRACTDRESRIHALRRMATESLPEMGDPTYPDGYVLHRHFTLADLANDPRSVVQRLFGPFASVLGGINGTLQLLNLAVEVWPVTHTFHPADGGLPFDDGIVCAIETPDSIGGHVRAVQGTDVAACAEAIQTTGPAGVPVGLTGGTFDDCAAVAVDYDCEVVDVGPDASGALPEAELRFASATPIPATGSPHAIFANVSAPTSGSTSCTYGLADGLTVAARVARVCRPRGAPSYCAEGVLCKTDGDPAAPAVLLGETLVEPTGDLACASGTGGVGLDLDGQAAGERASAMLRICLADLQHVASGPIETSLPELLEGQGCLAPGRFVAGLAIASEVARARAAGDGRAIAESDLALAHRLLARWIELHGFVARQSREAERLATVVRRLDPSDDGLPPGPGDMLEASVRGWSLLFHPRFGPAVASTPAALARSPDYRPYVLGEPPPADPDHTQAIGLVPVILETSAAQLDLAALLLERASWKPDAIAAPLAADALRKALWARAYAGLLEVRASGGTAPSWAPRKEVAKRGFDAALLRFVERGRAAAEGENPFGIDENDLPLYFLGDEASPGRRFSAVSDFFLGTGPTSVASWAPRAIERAETALGAARDAWTAFSARELSREISAADLAQRVQRVGFEFGDRVAAYCSAPPSITTAEIFDRWEEVHGRPFSADDCFIKRDEPMCSVDLDAYAALLRPEDVMYQLCKVDFLKRETRRTVGFTDPAYADLLDAYTECKTAGLQEVPCGDGAPSCLSCMSSRGVVVVDLRLAPEQLDGARSLRAGAAISAEAELVCGRAWPTAQQSLPSIDLASADAFDRGSCYRGALGEQALTLRTAAKDLEIVRSELAELEERYGIAMRSCLILQVGNARLEMAQAQHDAVMSKLRGVKLAADLIANHATALKDCASIGSSDFTVGAGTAVGCGAAALSAVATDVSLGIQLGMDEAQAAHDRLMTSIASEIEERRCFTDAEMHLVGTRTAVLRIQRAMQDLELGLYRFNEMKAAATTYYGDGAAALEVLRNRTVIPVAHDFWLSEALRDFERQMLFAKRVLYLSVVAVEYEYQISLEAKASVLAADLPSDLDGVLLDLWASSGTRGIGGRPSELTAVVSLREHLLQLADQSSRPAGEHALSDVSRFRLLLRDPRHAVHDGDGRWLGQRIPFALAPLGVLGLGDGTVSPLFAGEDCAERIWSVSANVLGTPGAVFVGGAPQIRVELEKSNVFYSRWCDPNREGAQLASVRPSKNLLRGGPSDVTGPFGLASAAQVHTTARLEAWSNVPAADFYDDAYANGDSTELAARGLYGDYALFIPATSISVPSADGERTSGIALSEVDDVLLRIDYISVAR